MLDTQPMSRQLFDLEGIFLDFLEGDARKPKSIMLQVEQEQIAISIPKELRASIRGYIQPGDRIRCIGRTKVDFKAGTIKLKAYQLFSLQSHPEAEQSVTIRPDISTSSETSHTYVHSFLAKHSDGLKGPTRSKILVCHKSGCQRQGGRQIAAALEQALQEHGLQDQVEIQYTGCQKRCSKAPSLMIMPGKHRYDRLTPQSISALVKEHFCPTELRSTSSHVDL
ncbi:MAG: (2Fe-2S) ferredoxin domain-containing protein [Leptolyngbyaceae cyanobacterium]